jgi:hypothetical protein
MRSLQPCRSYSLFISLLACFVVYLSCRKAQQEIPVTESIEKKAFFDVPANTDPVVTGILNALNRENEKSPFAEEMVKNAGHPQWTHAAKKSTTNLKGEAIDQLINIPLIRKGEKSTSAILAVNIVKADTAYELIYPQHYVLYGLDEENSRQKKRARDLFNVFANFDYLLFGTTQYFVYDGRLFGRKRKDTLLVTTEHDITQSRQETGSVNAINASSITQCITTKACVYAGNSSPSLRSNEALMGNGSCVTSQSCSTIWWEDGAGPNGPSTTISGNTVPGVVISSGGGSATGTTTTTTTTIGTNTTVVSLTNVPCVRIMAANLKEVPGSSPCTTVPWVPVNTEYLSKVGFITSILGLTGIQQSWLLSNSIIGNTIYDLLLEYGLSAETKAASLVTIEAARNALIQGPYNSNHFSKIQPFVPKGSLYSLSTINPVYWIHFVAQCAMIRADHPEWSSLRVYWEATSEIIHTGLDIIGMIPVVGEIADLTNGILYTIQGDGVNASLSFAATLPIAGWAATLAKYAKKTIYALDGTKRTLKWFKRADGYIDFGDRDLLRKVLGIKDSKVAHHIIPWEKWNHPLIQKLAKSKNGFHLNERYNGLALTEIQHLGSHNEYTQRVTKALDDILNKNLSDDDAFREVKNLLEKISNAINAAPTTKINSIVF